MNGTTTGNMKVRIERENTPSIDSNDYNIQKPVSVELVQGSASAMVKAKITLSDGTVLISDDFMFTTEAIGTDVYISSFVFKNGNVAGTISADIGLSNGSTLEANNFVVPTDPNVISSISDLQSRMTAVENGSVGGLDELKTTVDGHTTSINELNTDVASLKTDKADVNNNNQIITAGTINANNINKGGVAVATLNDIPDISGKVNIAQGTENAGKVLGINASGNVEPTEISSGGEVWEEVDLSNFPTDWMEGDRIRLIPKKCEGRSTGSGWNSACSFTVTGYVDSGSVIEFSLNNTTAQLYINYDSLFTGISMVENTLVIIHNISAWNGGGNGTMGRLYCYCFNGNNAELVVNNDINRNTLSTYISKMWRCRASA